MLSTISESDVSRWVPYDIARPLLDKKPYVVLTDFAGLQNKEPSSPSVSANLMELQNDDIGHEHLNNVLMDYDEEMLEPKSETYDDTSESETSGFNVGIEGDITNILIGLNGSRVRYKVNTLLFLSCIDDSGCCMQQPLFNFHLVL